MAQNSLWLQTKQLFPDFDLNTVLMFTPLRSSLVGTTPMRPCFDRDVGHNKKEEPCYGLAFSSNAIHLGNPPFTFAFPFYKFALLASVITCCVETKGQRKT